MEVGQGPNWGYSAKEKKKPSFVITLCVVECQVMLKEVSEYALSVDGTS
jgi:hypothetical protein